MFVMSLKHALKNSDQQIGVNKYRESMYPIAHSHEFYEIEYILSGNGIHNVGHDQIDTHPGDLFFTNISTEHSFRSLNLEEPLIVYNLIFHVNLLDNLQIAFQNTKLDTSGAARFISSTILSKPYIKLENVLEVGNILEQMYQESREQTENFKEVLIGLLIELLSIINTSYQQTKSKRSNARSINDVIDYINNHYSETLTTEKMSKIAMMSPSHFCATFKKQAGVTAKNYIMMKRLEKSKELLEHSEKTIAEISLMIGYESERYFRKIFKSQYGCSPKSYRIARGTE